MDFSLGFSKALQDRGARLSYNSDENLMSLSLDDNFIEADPKKFVGFLGELLGIANEMLEDIDVMGERLSEMDELYGG